MSIFSKALPIVGGTAGFILGGPAGAAVGMGVGGAASGLIEGEEVANQQRKAQLAQRRIANLQAARQRTEQVRNQIISQGRIDNVSASTGLGSSRASAASSSLSSQLGANLAFSAQTEVFSNQASSALQRSANAASDAALFNTISNIGFSLGKDAKFGGGGSDTTSYDYNQATTLLPAQGGSRGFNLSPGQMVT